MPPIKPAPLCKCGCGKQVTGRYGANANGAWKTYIDGHKPTAGESNGKKAAGGGRKKASSRAAANTTGDMESRVSINLNAEQLDRFLISLPLEDKTKLLQALLTK